MRGYRFPYEQLSRVSLIDACLAGTVQGIALSARVLGAKATICMPTDAMKIK